jgi:6-pyruvoyltetrahydropterin/6-carboxytetrahydropterin synthase
LDLELILCVEEIMFLLKVKGSFSAAHSIEGYQGKCAEIHGHSWEVVAVVRAVGLNELGIAYDFARLKEKLQLVLSALDHSYLNRLEPFKGKNPTAENIAVHIFSELKSAMPCGLELESVEVFESPTSSVIYKAED